MLEDTEEETIALQQWREMQKRQGEELDTLNSEYNRAWKELCDKHSAESAEMRKLLRSIFRK